MNSDQPSISKRLIIMFAVFCTAICGLLFVYSSYQTEKHLSTLSREYQQRLFNGYHQLLELQGGKLSTLITFLSEDQALKNHFREKKRSALYQHLTNHLGSLYGDQDSIELYFHTPDGQNFLRFQQPEKFGDLVPHYTLQSSIRSGQSSYGLELDSIGLPVLSVVLPWRDAGKLLGYIEATTTMTSVLEGLASLNDVTILLAMDKQYLNQNQYLPSDEEIKKTPFLYNTPEFLVLSTGYNQFVKSLLPLLSSTKQQTFYQSDNDGLYQIISSLPIHNSENEVTSYLYFLVDVSTLIAANSIPIISTTLILLALGMTTIGLFFFYGEKLQSRMAKLLENSEDSSQLQHKLTSLEQTNADLKQELVRQQENLNQSNKRYQTLFDKTADALLVIEGNRFIDCNQATLDMLGYSSKEELYNIHPSQISPKEQHDGRESTEKANEMIKIAFAKGSHRFEWDHKRKNGEVFPVEVLLTSIPNGDTNLLYTVWRDISERKKAEAEIKYRVNYDALTGLPNRNLLYEHLKTVYQKAIAEREYHAILFLDLDRFKNVNDSMGHTIGDQLLISCAKRIKSLLRPNDILARFGGDEFVVLVNNLGKNLQQANIIAERIAENIRQSFNYPVQVGQYELQVTLSAGITTFPLTDESIEDVLKYADVAMYKAKDTGRNRTAFFVSSMQESILRRLCIEKDLRAAMEKHEVYVDYQPQFTISGTIEGVEALARWNHPDYGLIPPEEFIAVAEDSGMISELGEHVLKTACKGIEQVTKETGKTLKLSINVSPKQLNQSGFVASMVSILDNFTLATGNVTLEVTEHVLIENFNSILHKLNELKNLGLKISLDDFGTGYSSLSYLKQLPLSELKIDRAFVMSLHPNSNDTRLVKTIIDIGHEFDLKVVAEGVETLYQLNYLKELNCNCYQGYYLSKPLSLSDLVALLKRHISIARVK